MVQAPVAVTCGDPSGIGPEIAYRAWQALGQEVPFFLIGDPRHLPEGSTFVLIDEPQEAAMVRDGLPVLEHIFPQEAVPGLPAPDNALGVVEVIERGVSLVLSGQASALTTAPISKKELVDHADFHFPGHTEFLGHLSQTVGAPIMMLASDELKVVPATIHIPLSDVPAALTQAVLEHALRVTYEALISDFGIKVPRLAVTGLNPHAGEGGMLGREDNTIITPVCDMLRAEGKNVIGPLPADTMFHSAARETYDAAVAMYHDQALVPIKTLAFDRGVNVTLGLPIVRTSPDHGIAFDIAGTGQANPTSMIEALRLAWSIAKSRAAA